MSKAYRHGNYFLRSRFGPRLSKNRKPKILFRVNEREEPVTRRIRKGNTAGHIRNWTPRKTEVWQPLLDTDKLDDGEYVLGVATLKSERRVTLHKAALVEVRPGSFTVATDKDAFEWLTKGDCATI